MYEKLLEQVSHFIELDKNERKVFESAFSFKSVPKNFTLVSQGEISNELYFINKGLLRLFYNNDGDYITGYIFRENHFAGSYASFLERTESDQILETVEDSELLVLEKEYLEELYERIPKINILTRKIAEQRFINSQRILSSFLIDTPEERYRKFLKEDSDLLLRVPHHIVASYLGITPVSLSRIRKRVSE